jgi:hypothetical protein
LSIYCLANPTVDIIRVVVPILKRDCKSIILDVSDQLSHIDHGGWFMLKNI